MLRSAPKGTTLTVIAAAAGVSVSTVSKVLNGRTDVAPGTRERISQLLRQHGYAPDPRPGFGVVDLLLGIGECPTPSRWNNPWAEELIHGAVVAAAEAQTSIIVTTVASAAEFSGWLDLASARGTDGALSVLHLPGGEELERLAVAGIPVVVIDPADEPGSGIRSVGTTNWQGGVSATRHLIELGHRRIAAIGGPGASGRAGRGWAASGRPCWTPACRWMRSSSGGTCSRRPAAGGRPWNCSPWRSRPPPSWPATTRRPSASCRRAAIAGCGPPAT